MRLSGGRARKLLELMPNICHFAEMGSGNLLDGASSFNLKEIGMAKGKDAKKNDKKTPQKTPKEKKAEKQAKKAQKDY